MGQTCFGAGFDVHGIDIENLIPDPAIGEAFAVRRPTVPVGRQVPRHQFRRAADGWKQIDRALAELDLVGNGIERTVGRDAVVVVALNRKAGVYLIGRDVSGKRQAVEHAIAVEQQILPIWRPVRRFEQFLGLPDDPIFTGTDIEYLD